MRSPNINDPLHFIGIGGSGMAPLAHLCMSSGKRVQGSDIGTGENLERLRSAGAKIFQGHDPSNLEGCATVVYSSAIQADNPELLSAAGKHAAVLHRSDLLASFLECNKGICVTGTHGKTTVSALCAHMLKELGVKPSAAIGGTLLGENAPFLWGDSEWLVAEADESDGSLKKYQPFISLLTNVDEDHLDVHKDIAGLKNLFFQFLRQTSKDGSAVIGWDNPICRELGHELTEVDFLSYGFVIGSDVRAVSYEVSTTGTRFSCVVERDQLNAHIPLVGKHNVGNALACLGVARAMELNIDHAAEALSTFKGVARRLQTIFANEQTIVFDDYAHNPGKITSCVTGLREAFPHHKIVAIFQPHRFSRLESLFDQFSSAFKPVSKVFVLPVYAAGELNSDERAQARMIEAIERQSQVAAAAASLDDATPLLAEIDQPTVLITLGAGDVFKLAHTLRDQLS